MVENLFEVNNLSCRYPSANYAALQVNQLTIQNGEIVFVVGRSGVGKSTFLETLGLMNNTIVSGSNVTLSFHPPYGFKAVSFPRLWSDSEKKVADFRKTHMSFIFQNTNLFKTLNVYQNIVLPAVLQGSSYQKAEDRTKQLLSEIGPDINNDKKIYEISEGQRQRVAFARAMVAQHSVLFADEPTGNLDQDHANNLMAILRNSLQKQGKTAIIVTHDRSQAKSFADKIVEIQEQSFEDKEFVYGLINDKAIYLYADGDWCNKDGDKL